MANRRIFKILLVTASVYVLLSATLSPASDRYSYPSIQSAFANKNCNEGIQGISRFSDTGNCVLDQPVTLPDAVRIALTNNPDSQMAVARIRQAEALFEKSRAAFYPTVSGYTEYTRADAPSAYLFKTIDQRRFAAGTDFNNPGTFGNYESGIHGRINLFNGGRDVLNLKISESGMAIHQADLQSIKNALTASVIRAYYDYLAAHDFIRIAMESESTVQAELEMMRVRLKAGGVLKSDVLSLEVRLAQAREDVLRSENQLKLAMAALANLLGVSPDKKILIRSEDHRFVNAPEEYADGVAIALNTRPELKKTRERLIQARMALDQAESDYLPTVDLRGKYYVDDPDMHYHRDRENWVVAVMLNWDLFTGFSTRADRKNTIGRIEELLAADRKTLLAIQLDVKNAYLRLSEAKARLEVAQKSVASAEESLSLVRKQFEGGSATITRYLDAELSRNTARTRSTRAYYDREQALAEIGRAIGVLGTLTASVGKED